MLKRAMFLPTLLVLGSCAGPSAWTSATRTSEQIGQDLANCQHDAAVSVGPALYAPQSVPPALGPLEWNRVHADAEGEYDARTEACMRAKGDTRSSS